MADIQPMSDERWAEIQRLAAFGTPPDALPSSSALARMIEDLVDEVERLRAALEREQREQREHANCEDVNARRFQTLTATIIDLTQQVTAMQQVDGAAIDELAFQRDINQQLGDENEQLRAQIAAMRPIVAFVESLIRYPGITKRPHDLLAQAEGVFHAYRAFVAAHSAESEA